MEWKKITVHTNTCWVFSYAMYRCRNCTYRPLAWSAAPPYMQAPGYPGKEPERQKWGLVNILSGDTQAGYWHQWVEEVLNASVQVSTAITLLLLSLSLGFGVSENMGQILKYHDVFPVSCNLKHKSIWRITLINKLLNSYDAPELGSDPEHKGQVTDFTNLRTQWKRKSYLSTIH